MPQVNPFSVERHGIKGHMSQVNPFPVVLSLFTSHMSHKSWFVYSLTHGVMDMCLTLRVSHCTCGPH